jgi:hypothetical protein
MFFMYTRNWGGTAQSPVNRRSPYHRSAKTADRHPGSAPLTRMPDRAWKVKAIPSNGRSREISQSLKKRPCRSQLRDSLARWLIRLVQHSLRNFWTLGVLTQRTPSNPTPVLRTRPPMLVFTVRLTLAVTTKATIPRPCTETTTARSCQAHPPWHLSHPRPIPCLLHPAQPGAVPREGRGNARSYQVVRQQLCGLTDLFI